MHIFEMATLRVSRHDVARRGDRQRSYKSVNQEFRGSFVLTQRCARPTGLGLYLTGRVAPEAEDTRRLSYRDLPKKIYPG
jgi:hypothetical protein